MKIQILLLIILCATLIHLFSPFTNRQAWLKKDSMRLSNYSTHSFQCDGLNPFWCDDPLSCDCDKECSNKNNNYILYEKRTIRLDENVIVNGQKLKSGTYCLPKQQPINCNHESSILLLSNSGWLCKKKPYWREDDSFLPCKSLSAIDNDANLLVDVLTNKPAGTDIHLFETFFSNDSKAHLPRYVCHCGSLDDRGNRMVQHINPYRCVPDYCTRQLVKVPTLGWNGHSCDCGPFSHVDPEDPTSPCIRLEDVTGYRDNVIYGKVECTEKHSLKLLPLLCPSLKRSNLHFTKKITVSNKPLDFVRMHQKSHPSIQYTTE